MTPDEQIATTALAEQVAEQVVYLQAQLSDARDELASSESIRHAEKEILIAEIEAHTKTRAELAEARLDTERWDFVARHIEAIVDGPGNKFGLEFSLNYEANASYRQRVREHIDAAREKEQKCQSKS